MKDSSILDNKQLFVSLLILGQNISLLEDRAITEMEVGNFYKACLEFHCTAASEILNDFLLDDEFLEHFFFSLLLPNVHIENELFVAENLKSYVHVFFSKTRTGTRISITSVSINR